jgi:hypothetical protein
LPKHDDEHQPGMQGEDEQQAAGPSEDMGRIRAIKPVGGDRHRLSPASRPTSVTFKYPAPRSLFMISIGMP